MSNRTDAAIVDARDGARAHDTERVGFNPHRQHRRSPADYLMVGAAAAVLIALVVWAIVG